MTTVYMVPHAEAEGNLYRRVHGWYNSLITENGYRQIAARVGAFAQEKVREHAGQQIIVFSHESPIWSYRHLLETGHPEHIMLLRHTALASVTSVTYDNETGRVMSITYVDPAANVK